MRKPSVRAKHVACKAAMWLAMILVAAWAGSSVKLAGGQQPNAKEATPTISFYPVAELTKKPGATPTLRGARLAKPADWPASFYTVLAGSSCTATMVGPRTLLTAAHCAPNHAMVSLMVAQKTYQGTCTRSDRYSLGSADGESADWALCLMESDVPLRKYESINSDAARVNVDTQLLLTGFGCTQANGTSFDGNYRIGEAKVKTLPRGGNNHIVTSGDAALCFGDSGGGAFLFLDAGKKRRVQVSVNSRVSTSTTETLGNDSYLSSLSTSAAQAFLKGWASQNGASICGLTSGATNCQN